MSKIFLKINLKFILGILLINILTDSVSQSEEISQPIFIGKENAPVEIKVYSSLTCPHCANFHMNVIPEIKKKYVNAGKVKIIFIDFPLDLAALNASKILHCVEKNKQMLIMDLIYDKQNQWAVGSNIEEINEKLKEIVTTVGINSNMVNQCFNNESIENKVLNGRIDGQKKYSISSTPTIIINEKKITGSTDFKNIEKEIKKII